MYVVLIIGNDRLVRWATVSEPTVPEDLLAQGETGFVIQPLDIKSHTFHEVLDRG